MNTRAGSSDGREDDDSHGEREDEKTELTGAALDDDDDMSRALAPSTRLTAVGSTWRSS